jgi:hypothetical protein
MPYSNLTFNVQPALSFVVNDFVQVTHDANNYIIGRVVSYNPSTGVLIITPLESFGSGTYSTWTVSLMGPWGQSGTSGAIGSSGNSNSSGEARSSGTSGTSGTTGLSGTAASSGDAGSSGTSASSGSAGTSASSGTQGLHRASGQSFRNGSSGFANSSGTSGFAGAAGSNGVAGGRGASRSSGTSGTAGAAGSPGSPGGPGGTGPTGPTGPGFDQSSNSGASPVYCVTTLADYGYAGGRWYMSNGKWFAGVTGPTFGGAGSTWATQAGIGATFFFNPSLRELKKDIQPYTANAVDIVNQTHIVNYNLEIDGQDDDFIGFIAEDTPTILSTEDHDRMDMSNTVGIILKAIQDLDKRVVSLQNK